MPRKYKKKFRDASATFKIPIRTLYYKRSGKHPGAPGGQTALTQIEERHFVDVLIATAEFGAPLAIFDLKMIIKSYLNKEGKTIKKFKNGDTPGKDWCYNFLDRHVDKLTQRLCQNIKQARALKTEEEMQKYFDHLAQSLKDVPPQNILNYDESNLTDDPGARKCIFRRGVKYPERVMNSSKSAISIMFAASASGTVLPPYVVYKAERLYDQWCIGGPKNTKYNRTKSGWFDAVCFQDWFDRIAVPWAKELTGRKILIGDNLSSHIQIEVVRQCLRNDIRLVFLPPNSTHITQPLDVGFFRPLKQHWRQIITEYKTQNPRNSTVNKSSFPLLLKLLMQKISKNQEIIIKNAFKATEIVPLNPEAVLKRLPSKRLEENVEGKIDKVLLSYLKATRNSGDSETPRRQKKMLRIEPGKSVSYEELYPEGEKENLSKSDEENVVEEIDEASPEAEIESNKVTDADQTLRINSENREKEGEKAGVANMDMDEEISSPKVGNFVIVQFVTKRSCKHFIGQVLEVCDEEYNIKFMRKCLKNGFVFPQVDDISFIKEQDIIKVLKQPLEVRRGIHKFDCEFSSYL